MWPKLCGLHRVGSMLVWAKVGLQAKSGWALVWTEWSLTSVGLGLAKLASCWMAWQVTAWPRPKWPRPVCMAQAKVT